MRPCFSVCFRGVQDAMAMITPTRARTLESVVQALVNEKCGEHVITLKSTFLSADDIVAVFHGSSDDEINTCVRALGYTTNTHPLVWFEGHSENQRAIIHMPISRTSIK